MVLLSVLFTKKEHICMVTRQVLNDYRYHNTLIEQQSQKIRMWSDQLKRMETSSGLARSNDKDMQKCYNDLVGSIKNIITQTAENVNGLLQQGEEIEQALEAIPDPQIRAVLYQRYILGADFDEIAGILGISRRNVYRLHGYGLDLIDKMGE